MEAGSCQDVFLLVKLYTRTSTHRHEPHEQTELRYYRRLSDGADLPVSERIVHEG